MRKLLLLSGVAAVALTAGAFEASAGSLVDNATEVNTTADLNNRQIQGQAQLQGQKQGQAQANFGVNKSDNRNVNANNNQNQQQTASQSDATGTGIGVSDSAAFSGGNTFSFESNSHVEANDIPVASAYAPHLWATEDTCMGSSSLGVQALSFGFSTGTTWRDEDCVRRKDARELYNMGNTMPQLRVASVARMCQKSANIAAMHAAGLQCPGEGSAAATTRVHGERFYGIHFDRVVEGSAVKRVSAPAPLPPVAEPRG